MKLSRGLIWVGVAAACIAGLVAAPIVGVETSCFETPFPRADQAPAFRIVDAGYRRAEGDSFLSYPEWYIVHAYADLAGVTRRDSKSAFDYLTSIRGFWSSLCRGSQVASRIGPVTADQKTTNYVIGISFSIEMGLQGLYERTIGALTNAIAGGRKTAEDEFNVRLLDTYTAFLYQTPWYQFPFGAELHRFWHDVPVTVSARGIERRFALSLQYAAKGAYASLIRYAASYASADLTIRSVIVGADSLPALDEHIHVIRKVDASDGAKASLVETPRYQAFTEIIRSLGKANEVSFLEIAGNTRILTTVIAPLTWQFSLAGTTEIFSIPIQSKPGWRRVGLNTPVSSLVRQVHDVESQGAKFEHAYDY